MDGGNDLERQAADPGTPLTTLQQLAQHHPELRATIAENPSTYPALLEWLGKLRMPDVDAALARRAVRAAGPVPAAPSEPRSTEPGRPTEPETAQPRAAAEEPATQPMERVEPLREGPEIDTSPTVVVPRVPDAGPAAPSTGSATPGQGVPTVPATPVEGVPTVPAHAATPESPVSPAPAGTPPGATTAAAAGAAAEGAEAPAAPGRLPGTHDDQRFDPDATAVYTDPDDLARGAGEPPTFAPTQKVERPAVVEPTDSPTVAMPPVVPTWTPTRGTPVPGGTPAQDSATRAFDPAILPGQPAAPVREPVTPPRHPSTRPAGPARGRTGAAPRADEQQRRRPTWMPLAILAAVALILVLVVLWQLSGGEDEEPRTPGATSAEAQDTGSPTAATTPADDGDAARSALVGLPESSSCTDPAADAGTFAEFASAAAPQGAWADPASGELVMSTLQQLQESCGNVYAVSVASAITGDGDAPEALRTTVTDAGTGWVELARAAPPGAQERTSFASPSLNISCELGDSARCTITEHDFAAPDGCSGPTTLVVGVDGDAAPDCTQPAAAGNGVLEYGQSATAGFFACTSEQSGMTCWSTLTGRGFSVARAGFQTF